MEGTATEWQLLRLSLLTWCILISLGLLFASAKHRPAFLWKVRLFKSIIYLCKSVDLFYWCGFKTWKECIVHGRCWVDRNGKWSPLFTRQILPRQCELLLSWGILCTATVCLSVPFNFLEVWFLLGAAAILGSVQMQLVAKATGTRCSLSWRLHLSAFSCCCFCLI